MNYKKQPTIIDKAKKLNLNWIDGRPFIFNNKDERCKTCNILFSELNEKIPVTISRDEKNNIHKLCFICAHKIKRELGVLFKY